MILNSYILLEYDDAWEPNYIDMDTYSSPTPQYKSLVPSERQKIIAQYDTVNKTSKYFGYGDIADAYKKGTAILAVKSYVELYNNYLAGKSVEPKILMWLGRSAITGIKLDKDVKRDREQSLKPKEVVTTSVASPLHQSNHKSPNNQINTTPFVSLFVLWAIITFFCIRSVVRGYMKFKDAKTYIKNVRHYYKGYRLFMRNPEKYRPLANKLTKLGYSYEDGMAIISIANQLPEGSGIYDIALEEYKSYLRNPKIIQAKQKEKQ